jgi:hypothetical protein
MTIKINLNDSIHLPNLNTSYNIANGGDGITKGDVITKAVFTYEPSNTATSTNTVDDPHKAHSSIDADTHAYQSNSVTNDQSNTVMAGIGGAGGTGMVMDSGNLDFNVDPHIHI